jgi:exonuclease VII small subunit
MHKLPLEKSKGPWKKGRKIYSDLKQEFRETEEKIDDIETNSGRSLKQNHPLIKKLQNIQKQMNKEPE